MTMKMLVFLLCLLLAWCALALDQGQQRTFTWTVRVPAAVTV